MVFPWFPGFLSPLAYDTCEKQQNDAKYSYL